jgi:hypothetical protein
MEKMGLAMAAQILANGLPMNRPSPFTPPPSGYKHKCKGRGYGNNDQRAFEKRVQKRRAKK